MTLAKKTRNDRNQLRARFHVESLEERAMMTTLVQNLAADWSAISPRTPDVVWSVNAGNQTLNHEADWVLENQSVWTDLNDGEVSQFKSAADLDFSGEFVYAVNAGGPSTNVESQPLVIGDAQFASRTITKEVCVIGACLPVARDVITAEFEAPSWYPNADYGDTPDDNDLEFVMQSIRWDRPPGFSIDLEVEPGETYKLQLLFAELWQERGFDIVIDGEEVVSDFVTYQEQSGINKKDTGVVYTREFVASDKELNIQLTGDAGVVDNAPVLNAFTLEKLEEGNGAPVWFQLSETRNERRFEGFRRGDVLVRPTMSGVGYGAANVTWTSPEDTMISVSGGLWTMDEGVGDFQWRLDRNGHELTSGTLLANEFTREDPFDVRSGEGGTEAVRNVLVKTGDELRLTVTGSEPEFVAVDLSVISDSLRIPRYPLGGIPAQDATLGDVTSFFVDVSDEALDSLSMTVSGLSAQGAEARVSLDANGLFTYTPDVNDKFDLTVAFEAVVDGVRKSQQVTIRTNEIENELDLVAKPGVLPDETEYVVVGEEVLHEDVFFNTQNRKTRRVEISGKRVNLVPGDENGLFERFVYSGESTNADIRELSIYAETVVVGGELHLPGTDVTIYAKELIFEDIEGHVARINTTPLDYLTAAAGAVRDSHLKQDPGEDGRRGEDAGNLMLHVNSLRIPHGSESQQRFILRGGAGQEAGAGLRGANGQNRRVLVPEDGVPVGSPPETWPLYADARGIANVLKHYPTTTYIQWNDIAQNPSTIYGDPSFPTDGKAAIPGGRPGGGGTGGRLTAHFDQLSAITDVSGGAAGRKAADQPGGQAGTPRTAYQIEIPVIGDWGVKQRDSSHGRKWNAPSGNVGSSGRLVRMADQAASDWLHPAGMRALISYAKDAYLNGHNELAAELFNEYGNLLDEATTSKPEFASQFTEQRTEVSTFEHQLANHLDYFGNPSGWAPTLSFAANYRAFQNAIDSDLRTLFLTRLVQAADAQQETKLALLDKLISELDQSIDHATTDLNDAQGRLPGLQGDLQDIVSETKEIQDEIAVRERRLTAQAESNVFARNALRTIGGLLSVVPIPAVAGVGVGLTALNGFIADPSVSGFAEAANGIADPFKQATLDASSDAISEQLDMLKPPSDVNSATLKDYGGRLGRLGAKWSPLVSAFQEVTSATQVPSGDVSAELQKLRAQDPTFNSLIGKLERLLAKKQIFAAELAQTMNAISTNLNIITSGYAAADALNQERSVESERTLSHSSLDRVNEIERSARDRLLRYQYNLAKAFEYETLEPYSGDRNLGKTFDEIVRLLDVENAGENWLDDPQNFASLQSIYESELREVADQIWNKLNTNAPQRTSEIKLKLSANQLSALNTEGKVTINLIEMGFINAARQDVKLLQMGVEEVRSVFAASNETLAANVQFRFEHSGSSIIQSNGTKYAFQHVTDDDVFFWSTDYDAIGGELIQSEVSPSDVETVSALLDREVGSLRSPYAHPGAWSSITIHAETDVVLAENNVASDVKIDFQELTLFVRFDSDLPQTATALLDIRTPDGISPHVLVNAEDVTGRGDGTGSFTRFYVKGREVVLTAQPVYGRLQFSGWLNERGEKIGDDPTLSLTLSRNTQVRASYDSIDERIAGDANGDGEVGFADFLVLANNFGKSTDVAFADGDFDASGEVNFTDFLILANAFGQNRNS